MNGDSFSRQPSPSGEMCSAAGQCLRYAPATHGLLADEQVALPAEAIPLWFFHWMLEANAVLMVTSARDSMEVPTSVRLSSLGDPPNCAVE